MSLLRVESMVDESYIFPADGCEAATYTSQDRHLRIIGVEKMSALHHADGHSGVPTPSFPIPENVEDSGEGLFESTSEVAPFDEGDRIGVVEFSLRRHSDAPTRSVSQPFLFLFIWGRTEWPIGCTKRHGIH